MRNWPIASGVVCATGPGVAPVPQSARTRCIATQDYFGGGAWTAARACNMPYRNAPHNPRHRAIVTRRTRRPAKYGRTRLRYSILTASIFMHQNVTRAPPPPPLTLHSILKLKQFCNRCSHLCFRKRPSARFQN